MNVHFSSIPTPNAFSDSSLQKIDSDSSNNFEVYDKKTLLPPNGNCLENNIHSYYEESFYKKRIIPYNINQEIWTDDIISENIFPRYDMVQKQMNSGKKLIFDISSVDTEKYITKNKSESFKNNEFANLEEQKVLNEQIMTEIEQLQIEENQTLSNPNSIYETKNQSLKFDLRAKDIPFQKDDLPIISNDELITPPSTNLNTLTQSMFIHNEVNSNTSNNSIHIDNTAQSESYFDKFIQSMKVIILKFDCKKGSNFEPFSQEWLNDLNISKKDFDEQIKEDSIFNSHFESSNSYKEHFQKSSLIQVSVKGDITEEYSPIISKILRNEENFINSGNRKQIMEMIETIKKDYSEKEIPAENLPNIVYINSMFFSNDDIAQFSNFFKNLKFIGVEFKKQFLFTINDKIANIFIIQEDFDSMISDIVDILCTFSQVVITTTTKPRICLPKRIKWRYITSHSQIAAAILPFLIEENLAAQNNSKHDNKPL